METHLDVIVSTVRTTRYVPFVSGLVIGTGIIVLPLLAGYQFQYLDATFLVRLAMIITIGGATFILDDPTLETSHVMPTTAARIAVLRTTLAMSILAPVLALHVALAPHLIQSQEPFHGWGLLIEPLALLPLTWAIAWYRATHHPDGSGGALAAPALFITIAGFAYLPTPLALYLATADPNFTASRLRWLTILTIALTTYALALHQSTRPPPHWPRTPKPHPT